MTEMLDVGNIDAFAEKLHGSLTRQGDPDYDEVRALYNAMIDKRPALIARCADRDDVVAAVNFGREQGLDIAIRCGGHNGPGLGSVDDGLVIDLSGLKTITVDPDSQTATIGGGCLFGDVDAATHEHGLATPGGIISTTGAGGLTPGRAIGPLTRTSGLAADNPLAEGRSQPGLLMDGVQPMPLPALQSAFDAVYPPGDQWYWRADFVESIPDEAVEKHAEFGAKMPTWKCTMHMYPIDGAAHRLGS